MKRYVVPAEDFAWREAEGQLLVLHVPTSQYAELNASAAVLWEAMVEGATTEELERALTSRYDLTPDRAAADVEAFLSSLRRAGLLPDDV